jgi:hypothetical protein
MKRHSDDFQIAAADRGTAGVMGTEAITATVPKTT